MDKASASGAGDCGFESHRGRFSTGPFLFFPTSCYKSTCYFTCMFFFECIKNIIIIMYMKIHVYSTLAKLVFSDTLNTHYKCRCLLRVLDTFGTEPVFNYKKWKPEKDNRNHDYGHTWGNWELNPRQFMTMYRKRLT